MMKTFFERVSIERGDVLINYTSAVKDATLRRCYRYTISHFETSEILGAQSGFVSLIQARNSAWSNLGMLIESPGDECPTA